MKRISTLVVYGNWDEESSVIEWIGGIHRKFLKHPLKSRYHFWRSYGSLSLVAGWVFEGSNTQDTFLGSQYTELDKNVTRTPTLFFVEVDDEQKKITKVLSKMDTNITRQRVETEYLRLLDGNQPPAGTPADAGSNGQLGLLRFRFPDLWPFGEIPNWIEWALAALIIIAATFFVIKFSRK